MSNKRSRSGEAEEEDGEEVEDYEDDGDYNFHRYEDDGNNDEDDLNGFNLAVIAEDEEVASAPNNPMNRLVQMAPHDVSLANARRKQYECIDEVSFMSNVGIMCLLYGEQTRGITLNLLEDIMEKPESYHVHF
jgi:hypothetical protein